MFSTLPGRYAAQLLGIVGSVGAVISCALAWRNSDAGRVAALSTVAVELILVRWLAGPGATREQLASERGVNLEASRGTPRVWLVAHIDSKSQPIPTAVRSLGFLLLLAALTMAVLVAPAAHSLGPVVATAIAAVAGGGILSLASVGASSPGAADNASGIAAVLGAAERLEPHVPVGVLITDAEELALAGARAWVAERADKTIAFNCDTIDDDGDYSFIAYGSTKSEFFLRVQRTYGRIMSPSAKSVGTLVSGVGPSRHAVYTERSLPGVLTDSVAFRDAKWETVTLARGTLRTLGKIHTRRDSLDHLSGSGIPDAARILAGLVEEFA